MTKTPHGLRIHGRVDGVFKLQNGEKIASAVIESRVLAASPLLEQALALGPGDAYTTALVWLNQAAAQRWAEEQGLEASLRPSRLDESVAQPASNQRQVSGETPGQKNRQRFALNDELMQRVVAHQRRPSRPGLEHEVGMHHRAVERGRHRDPHRRT